MQVIFRGTYWLRFWSMLQHKETTKDLFIKVSTSLEMIGLEVFASHDGSIIIDFVMLNFVFLTLLLLKLEKM